MNECLADFKDLESRVPEHLPKGPTHAHSACASRSPSSEHAEFNGYLR
jgi:hypothetical protein